MALLILLLGACQSPLPQQREAPRRGGASIQLLIWGDQRPSCSTGQYDPMVREVLNLLGREAQKAAPDAVIGTGDYICAWPHQPDKALQQIESYLTMMPLLCDGKLMVVPGNHEAGHAQLLRSSALAVVPMGWREVGDVRVVWLPSDQDLEHPVLPAWLDEALSWRGRLVVIRHEPWGACGTRGDHWIRDRVRAARPNLTLHGHIHNWLAPGAKVMECGAPYVAGPREFVIGNGGAPGWLKSAGWAGVSWATLRPDGSALVRGVDIEGIERAHVEVQP